MIQITEIVNRYKGEGTPLMMILSDIQKEYGYIPLEVQELVSDLTGIPVSEIYGVVTFYSFFSLTPKGKHVIGVCLGTACYVKGSQLVLDKFAEKDLLDTVDLNFSYDLKYRFKTEERRILCENNIIKTGERYPRLKVNVQMILTQHLINEYNKNPNILKD